MDCRMNLCPARKLPSPFKRLRKNAPHGKGDATDERHRYNPAKTNQLFFRKPLNEYDPKSLKLRSAFPFLI